MHLQCQQRLRISSPAGLLAVVPHLLGFTPESSLVVLGVAPPAGRIKFGLRYDLPDPPDTAAAAGIAAHAAGILGRYQLTTATVAGYGPGPLVTPVADAIRDMASREGVALLDVLRVQDGRFWSYLCRREVPEFGFTEVFSARTQGFSGPGEGVFPRVSGGRLRRSGWRWLATARISGIGGGGRGRR